MGIRQAASSTMNPASSSVCANNLLFFKNLDTRTTSFLMNPITLRLLNQQLVAPQFSDAAELIDYMGGTICGNWTPFKDALQATFFENDFCTDDIQDAWQNYQRFRVR